MDSALTVVIGADTFPPDVNGAARFAQRLATGLAGRGHRVHVICPSDTGPAGTVHADGVTVHRLRSIGTPFHPTFRICPPTAPTRAECARLLAELQPDVLHVQAHFLVGRALLRTAGDIPVVATNHFMPENLFGHLRIPEFLRQWAGRRAWADFNRMLGAAKVVTTPTPIAAKLLTDNGFPGEVLPVSCGVELAEFQVHALTGQPPTVLFVGRLDEEKRVHELLRALPLLPQDTQVELVGDGSRRADLTALAQRLGVAERVRFRGFVSQAELVDAYARCTVFCMPGVAELQSLATMEAMAAGKPVVAADAMALPHLVHPDRNGWLYRPGNVTELAGRLADVLTVPGQAARMGAASRALIANHELAATLRTFEDLYLQAIGRRPVVTASAA